MVFHGSTKARLQLNFKRIFPPLLLLYAAVSCVTATAKSAVDVDGLGPHRVALEYPIDHNLRTRFHTHTYTQSEQSMPSGRCRRRLVWDCSVLVSFKAPFLAAARHTHTTGGSGK